MQSTEQLIGTIINPPVRTNAAAAPAHPAAPEPLEVHLARVISAPGSIPAGTTLIAIPVAPPSLEVPLQP